MGLSKHTAPLTERPVPAILWCKFVNSAAAATAACSSGTAAAGFRVTDDVRKGGLAGGVEIDLKGIQAKRQHREIAEAADDVDHPIAAEQA